MKTPLFASLVLALAVASACADPTAQVLGPNTSPFGIGADAHSSRELPKWMPQMATIGITQFRTVNSTWGGVEPSENQWNWDQIDSEMNYVEGQHITFGGLLYGVPNWDTADRPGTLPVNNIPAWSAYVSQLVKHVKGRIKFYEIWNEPPNGTGRFQTPADYAKVVVAAYDAAKAADPTCMIGMAAKSVDLNYLYQAINAGAKDHFDYITLHPYEVLGCVMEHPGTEAVYMSIVPSVHKMLADIDPARANAPVVFTELGYDARKDAKVPAYAITKAYSMAIAQGLTCLNWFESMDADSGPMGLLQSNGTARPAYTAMAQMIKHLGKHPTYIGWVLFYDHDYGFVFQGTNGPVLTLWAPKGGSDKIDFLQPVRIIDPLTGNETQSSTCSLNEAPVIVENIPAAVVTVAQNHRNKPFPWDGDYTNAKSVSVTMGDKNIEKGLHTQSAASIAANVVLYGGSARSGSVPGGNVFMVDPNFLSYTSTPIEISVVTRRDAKNDPAQLNLEYESTTGYKKATPYAVPDNTAWHTATWRIEDAQFVSMWDFSFRLNSGSYVVQSVTVTKLSN